MAWACFLLVLIGCSSVVQCQNKITDTTKAQDALDEYNRQAEQMRYEGSEAAWNFYTNITTHNEQIMLNQNLVGSAFTKEAAQNMSIFDTTNFPDLMKREIEKIKDVGVSGQTDETKLKRLGKVLSEMETIYSTAKVCLTDSNTDCSPLDPDLTELFSNSRDYDKLLKAWVGWRDQSGKKMKDLYTEFVTLSNEALALSGHADTGSYWRSSYEMDNFEAEVKGLFDELLPLYEQLHAYVRRKLKGMYGADKFPSSGHIPAHLLGNMWAQQWNSLAKDLIPFKDKNSMDVTDELVKQGYDATRIFETADNFFTSLGLIQMPQEFWDKSMLEKPKDGRQVVCHASAWDFYNKKDFRIKMCTVVTHDDFITVHHEMGHVEYFLQYKNHPLEFRDGANPDDHLAQFTEASSANSGWRFHEAVGDVMSLSVQTPEHMYTIGLLNELNNDAETDINFLMNMALQKIAFLPFGYLIDQWRWSVFRDDTKPDDYTKNWWDLRCKYQGVSSPVERSSSDFDPGAKYHIPANTPYIRYFVSFVIQFQFHKAACVAAGNTKPLHRCDIYNSRAAGKVLEDMLKLGSSKLWPEAMEQLTGQRSMSAQPLMEYFEPLLQYLRKENGNDVGWNAECPDLSQGSAVLTPSLVVIALVTILNLIRNAI